MKPNFIYVQHGMLGWKFVQMLRVTWPRWLPGPYMVKTFKHFLLRSKRWMTFKLGIRYRVLKYCQICSNDDTWLTLSIFMMWSNLFPNASVWVKAYTVYSHVFPGLFFFLNSAYPMHSCERYRTNGPLVLFLIEIPVCKQWRPWSDAAFWVCTVCLGPKQRDARHESVNY